MRLGARIMGKERCIMGRKWHGGKFETGINAMRRLGGKLARAVLLPVRANALFFLFMYLLGAVCCVAIPYGGSRMVGVFELFSDLYLLCVLLLLFPHGVRCVLRSLLCAVFYLIAVVDMALYVRFGSPIVPIHIQMLMQTDEREATEALETYLSTDLLASPLSLILLVLAAHLLALHYRKPLAAHLAMAFSSRRRALSGVCSVLVVLLFCLGFFPTTDSKEYIFRIVALEQDELQVQQAKDFNPKTTYYLPIYRAVYALSENHRLGAVRRELAESMRKASVDSCTYTSPDIVLIIGESLNRSHMSLYGYDKATTPCQERCAEAGGMAVFSDAVSPWNVTCEAFQSILSTHCAGMPRGWSSQPLFPAIFRKACYTTTLLSNQFVLRSGSFSAFKEDLFLNNPVFSKQMFDFRNDATHTYDEGLLDDYNALFEGKNAPIDSNNAPLDGNKSSLAPADSAPCRLTIFHFLGVHADFNARYPKAWAKYSGKDYRWKDLSAAEREVLASYDNAVRYNDHVIGRIIQAFEHKDAVIVFLSDHGERVFDNGSKGWGRTLTWDRNDVVQQFEVPFWIYASPQYRRKRPRLWERIQAVKDKPYMTDALPHLLFRLAGIHSRWYSPQHDILDSRYDAGRKRLLRNERDYDQIVR